MLIKNIIHRECGKMTLVPSYFYNYTIECSNFQIISPKTSFELVWAQYDSFYCFVSSQKPSWHGTTKRLLGWSHCLSSGVWTALVTITIYYDVTLFYLGALNYIPVLEKQSTAPKTMSRNFILLFQIGFIAANSNEHPSMKLNTFLKSKYREDIFCNQDVNTLA